MSRPALEMREVTVRFGEKTVLQGFSMTVEHGEKVTLAGPSGSGKSTVLRCLLGFVPVEFGEVYIEGELLTAQSVWHLRTRMAYVAQEPELGEGTVEQILQQPFRYRANADLRDNIRQVPDLCARLLLPPEILSADISTLSGGEKQRVAIIAALLLERRIFLLDEASSALDRKAAEAVHGLFRERENISGVSIAHEADRLGFDDREILVPQSEGIHP